MAFVAGVDQELGRLGVVCLGMVSSLLKRSNYCGAVEEKDIATF